MPVDPWDAERRPPCWPVGQPCPNLCARAHYEHVVHNHVELAGPWAGWRLAGRYLVGPGPRKTAPRITVERLRGILWAEVARAKAKSGVSEGAVVSIFRQKPRPDSGTPPATVARRPGGKTAGETRTHPDA